MKQAGARGWLPWVLAAVWILVGVQVTGLGGRIEAKYRTTIGARAIIRDYLANHGVRKLQIGAGAHRMAGWLNTDIEPIQGEAYLDAMRPFSLPDQSFRYVYSEHLIEHLTRQDGLRMLRECYRILAPGGRIRIATPNLLVFVHLFDGMKTDAMRNYMGDKMRWHNWPATASPEAVILNLQLRSFGHQFVYDPATLRESLELAGFRGIAEFRPGQSDDPQLRGVEMRQASAIREVNDYETMVFEAVRPG